jgi:AraC family L-rhamnose operon transcriptional activator RhaR
VRVDHVRRLLAEDLRAPWTVELLARRVHVTPSYLNELCTRHAGAPPIRLLARLRAERAADLLRTTDLTVTRIAAEVGWADPNLFARRFKAHFGLAPGAYRRAVHGDVPASSRPAVEARP